MSLRGKPGAYFTNEGMLGPPDAYGSYFYLLVNSNGLHCWVDCNWKDLHKCRGTGWNFTEGEDEHIIEGAALVAPLPILFWEK